MYQLSSPFLEQKLDTAKAQKSMHKESVHIEPVHKKSVCKESVQLVADTLSFIFLLVLHMCSFCFMKLKAREKSAQQTLYTVSMLTSISGTSLCVSPYFYIC